jgi:tetratricopeptide (TPR) repeat protein
VWQLKLSLTGTGKMKRSEDLMESEPPSFEKTLQTTAEYIGDGKWNESWNELENLAPEFRRLPQVIVFQVLILNNLEKWEEAATLGKDAIQKFPEIAQLYVVTAQALCETEGAASAKKTLLAGESLLRNEAIFHLSLATYDRKLGNLEEAQAEMKRAFELDENIAPIQLREGHENRLRIVHQSVSSPPSRPTT